MKNTHPIEALLLGVWLALEAAAVLLAALLALLLTLARWRPAPDISADLRESLPVAEAAAPPAEHPLALLADALQQLPHRELMTLAGTRRRLPKYQLAAMVAACS